MRSVTAILRTVVAALMLGGLFAAPALAQPAPAPAFAGLKKTVAVDMFGGAELTQGMVAADGLAAMLTDILSRDGRFVVVERQALSSLQTEQQLGQGGSTTAETSAQPSRLIGAALLVKGAVTKFNPNAGGVGLRIGGMPSGSKLGLGGGVGSRKTTLSVSLRLIDTTTGQVISTVNADGAASSREADAGVLNKFNGSTVGLNTFRGTSLGKAAEDAITKAVAQIALDAGKVPWSGLVVDVRSDAVIINAGADQNVQPGMTFGVYRKGEVLTDPGTGAVLDVAIDRLGALRVDTVREKVSTARLVDGQSPMRGDMLKSE